MATDPANPSEEISREQIDAALADAGGQTADAPAPTGSNPPPTAATPTDPPAPTDQPAPAQQTEPSLDPSATAAADSPKPDDNAAQNPDAAPSPAGQQPDNVSAESPEASTGFSQADIDAALAAAETQPSEPTPEPNATPPPESIPAPPATTTEDGTPKLDSQGRPFDEAAALMEAAIAEERAAAEAAKTAAPAPAPTNAVPLDLPDFTPASGSSAEAQNIALLNDVKLDVKIELGRSHMLIEDVLKLGTGSVVELDKLAGDPVDVLVNERIVARGEVLVLNDNFCVRISEILVGPEMADATA